MPNGAPRSYLPKKNDPALLLWHFEDPDFSAAFPALGQLLAAAQADGSPREGATLTLFSGEGRLKAVLTDKHTTQALWMTLQPGADVLGQVEAAIVSGKGEWKPSKVGWVKK